MSTAALLRAARALRAEALVVVATVALTAFHFFLRADTVGVFSPVRGWNSLTTPPLGTFAHFALSALVLGVLPALAARRLTGRSWSDLGLGVGAVRPGLALVAAGIPLALLAGHIAAAAPAMRAVYPLDPGVGGAPREFLPYALSQFLYYGAWEVLFRGVLLFGLKDRLGAPLAVALQAALSVTAHFGRPMNETIAAIPAGLAFGAASLRLRSIWYVAVLHWLVGVTMDWYILRRAFA